MISVGINYSQMHDSSACIARDGEVLFAVAEERLSRIKHDASFPTLSIRACLEFAALAPSRSISFANRGRVHVRCFCTIWDRSLRDVSPASFELY